MKTAASWIRFCATTAKPEQKWPHGRKAYFRGATWTWCPDFNHWENLAQYMYSKVSPFTRPPVHTSQVFLLALWVEREGNVVRCLFLLLRSMHVTYRTPHHQSAMGVDKERGGVGGGGGWRLGEGRLVGLIGKRISLFEPICSPWSPQTRVRTSFGVQRFRPLLQR